MKTILQLAFGTFLFLIATPSSGQSTFGKSFSNIEKLEISVHQIEINYHGNPEQQEIQVKSDLDENQENNLIFVTIGNTLKISYQGKRAIDSKKSVKITGPENIQLQIHNASSCQPGKFPNYSIEH
ncbi:hypothetical protein QWY93_03780 [Echinicola jeungdonensis]|uniref:Auto-transporter adhesin head GIN domain-containing protein n=1 Tax=Echinicola jeungdonensis TaxID=709343 RepID=A0ABV5J1C1_9BACT|nr:hypothetical protein [Echinicola jeungdonensis]MDN3668446.1 hypothetical protein [Echinicola jeungdonensis]